MARKRRSGDGSIRKRKTGGWEARYTDRREVNPQKRRKSITGKTRAEVEEKMRLAIKEVEKNPDFVPHNLSFGEWLDQWMRIYKKATLRGSVYEQYKGMIRLYIKPFLGNIPLMELKGFHIQSLYAYLLQNGSLKRSNTGLSPSTVHKIKNVISGSLKKALANNLITSNPIEATELPPATRAVIQVFDKAEQREIARAAQVFKAYHLFMFALTTGMRIGEILALKISDVDFENKYIMVNKSISRTKDNATGENKITIGPPKTKYSVRKVPLMPSSEIVLKRQLDMLAQIKAKAKHEWNKHEILFPNSAGEYRTQSGTRTIFCRVLKEAGIKKGTVHALRHTYVTNALNGGVAAQNVAKVIGHRDGSITLKYYAHYIKCEADEQLREFDKCMCEINGLPDGVSRGGITKQYESPLEKIITPQKFSIKNTLKRASERWSGLFPR